MAFISFDSEMKERFGGKVYRLSLSTGCTCPNRDGKCGTGGCIFCSAGGSGEFAEAAVLPVEIQIEKAKEKVAGKLSRNFAGYLAYFQSFTNTYIHDAGVLKKLLMMIPADMTVHRITGDPPKALLISPKWTADKKKTINYLRKYAYQDQT